MSPSNLRITSDADLVDACIPTELELRIESFGGFVPAVVSVGWLAGVVTWMPFPMGLVVGLLSAPLVLLSSFVAFSKAQSWRARREFAELQRRFGLLPVDAYLAELEGVSGVLLGGRGLPHGDSYWVLIRVEEGAATIEARVGRPFMQSEVSMESLAEIAMTRRALSAAEFAELDRLSRPELGSVPPSVVDGFPCEVAVFGDRNLRRATANLGGLSDVDRQEPSVLLMSWLLDLVACPRASGRREQDP